MAIHRIRLLGDPVLRTRCQRVLDPKSSAVRVVADDLRETLQDWRERYGYGRGIAAPQIGAPIRLVYLDPDRPMVLVNPEIVDIGDEDFSVWDDCFSFPDLMVRVQRAYRIEVAYQDLRGETHTLRAEGALAELLQHELDHLDGVLAVDRAAGLDPFCLRQEWHRHWEAAGRYGKPAPREAPRPTAAL